MNKQKGIFVYGAFLIGMGIAPAHHFIWKIVEACCVTYGALMLVYNRLDWFSPDEGE